MGEAQRTKAPPGNLIPADAGGNNQVIDVTAGQPLDFPLKKPIR